MNPFLLVAIIAEVGTWHPSDKPLNAGLGNMENFGIELNVKGSFYFGGRTDLQSFFVKDSKVVGGNAPVYNTYKVWAGYQYKVLEFIAEHECGHKIENGVISVSDRYKQYSEDRFYIRLTLKKVLVN